MGNGRAVGAGRGAPTAGMGEGFITINPNFAFQLAVKAAAGVIFYVKRKRIFNSISIRLLKDVTVENPADF